MRCDRVWASAILGIALAAACMPAHADPPARALAVSLDAACAPASSGAPLGVVTGRAALAGADAELDLILAIDVSHSTAQGPVQRGWRRWLAWLLPRRGAPVVPDRLTEELERAHELLARLDPRTTRVGVVAFAGDLDPRTPDAWVAAPLGDIASAGTALHALRLGGSSGATNLIAALDRSRGELQGELGARSRARSGVRRAVLLLTDGVDVHPLHRDPGTARELLRSAVARTLAAGIDVDVVALAMAPDAALAAIADTGGRLHRGRGAPAALEPDSRIEIALHNASSGARVLASGLPDGRFAALVPLVPGSNAIEVHARARSGGEARAALELRFRPGAPPPPLEDLRVRNAELAAHLRASRAARHRSRQLVIEAPAER